MDTNASIDPFEYDDVAGRIAFGRGMVDRLGSMLADAGGERALVVCGENVGANSDTMDPIDNGLGESFAGTFDGTTPEKNAEEAFAGLDALADTDADALVAVGGGSSIDVARAMCALYDGGSYEDVRADAAETGMLPVSDDPLPLLAVPTTLAGADLSTGGSVTFSDAGGGGDSGSDAGDGDGDDGGDEAVTAAYGDPALMPDALVYDPDLFETTPTGVLAGSAMNGFDKGLELPYSRHANPLTDAPALRGLSLLGSSLPRLREASEGADPGTMDRIVAGIVCVQYGRATRSGGLLSVIHAFGHGLRAEGVQQGVAHAVMAPPVLEYLFERVDGRRELLADALDGGGSDVGDDGSGDDSDYNDPAVRVVDRVRDVRDGMDLPTRLRDLDGLERDALSGVACVVENDSFLANGPQGLDPTAEEIEAVLDAAW
jgi:alcohol dehydrogenase class IV